MRKNKLRRVAVLGSGTAKETNPVYQQAIKLGEALAKADFTVYHGGYGGVMEAVARGCRSAGGRNVGVAIQKKGTGTFSGTGSPASGRVPVPLQKGACPLNPYADAEIMAPTWQKRLFKLIEMGDAYIFLDGATGTLNELFFVWEMANKKLFNKPVIILGKRLQGLVKFLKKDSSLKIPNRFYLVSSIPQAIKLLKNIS